MTIERYTRTAMVLHWLIALFIFINVALIWSVDILPEDSIRPVIDAHKSFGITVLGLVLMRILWRFANRPPPLPDFYAPAEKTAAHAAHIALYGVMLALPLTGWMHDSAWKAAGEIPMYWFGLIQWPRIGWIMHIEPGLKERLHDVFGSAHTWLSYVLYALVGLHIAAALKHQWWDHHPELQRMLPGETAPPTPLSPAPRPPA
ncbi:MAG: cytochrome b [Tardiphaga sp.]